VFVAIFVNMVGVVGVDVNMHVPMSMFVGRRVMMVVVMCVVRGVLVLVQVLVGVCRDRLPQADRPHNDHEQQDDAADKHGQRERIGQDS
jgi:hypothetical protein